MFHQFYIQIFVLNSKKLHDLPKCHQLNVELAKLDIESYLVLEKTICHMTIWLSLRYAKSYL